jgi:hypothetical protein
MWLYLASLPKIIKPSSPVDSSHPCFRIAQACGHAFRRYLINPFEVFLRYLHIERGNILLQIFASLRAWNRYNIFTLRQHPGQSELRWSASLLSRDLSIRLTSSRFF